MFKLVSSKDRFLAEIAQNRKNCSKTKKISNHDEIETERPRATRPPTREEIRKRIERRKAASLKVTQGHGLRKGHLTAGVSTFHPEIRGKPPVFFRILHQETN